MDAHASRGAARRPGQAPAVRPPARRRRGIFGASYSPESRQFEAVERALPSLIVPALPTDQPARLAQPPKGPIGRTCCGLSVHPLAMAAVLRTSAFFVAAQLPMLFDLSSFFLESTLYSPLLSILCTFLCFVSFSFIAHWNFAFFDGGKDVTKRISVWFVTALFPPLFLLCPLLSLSLSLLVSFVLFRKLSVLVLSVSPSSVVSAQPPPFSDPLPWRVQLMGRVRISWCDLRILCSRGAAQQGQRSVGHAGVAGRARRARSCRGGGAPNRA